MIEISIKMFGYSIKFDVLKKIKNKKIGFTEMFFFCHG